jgi:hypothetical protein
MSISELHKSQVYKILFPVLGLTTSFNLSAQGCSDAGACSISTFQPKPESFITQKKNSLSFGFTAGAADHSIFVLTPRAGYSRKLGDKWSTDVNVTYAWHFGKETSTGGFGDVYFNINYLPVSKFQMTSGLKIPLNRANKIYKDDLMLPMDYQSSLGTLDLITAVSYHPSAWQFTLGWQQPLDQNENEFFPAADLDLPFKEFRGTNGFQRKADFLLRLGKTISPNENFKITPALLAIYHVNDDWARSLDVYKPISGSKGLTLNATLFLDIKLKGSGKLEFNIGFPLVVREIRPEGLTRSFVAGCTYSADF